MSGLIERVEFSIEFSCIRVWHIKNIVEAMVTADWRQVKSKSYCADAMHLAVAGQRHPDILQFGRRDRHHGG